jgi:arylsulfatase
MGPENGSVGNILKGNGYATAWFGKNHNTPDYVYSVAGPFDQWPSGMGFEYFYGFQGGETDQWTPYLFQDHTQIFPWINKPGYNLTTDLADQAIARMKGLQAADPGQPWLIYYATGGTHSHHQPKQEWVEKMKGKFDMGWNVMRDSIFANQKRLGVLPANAQLTPWPKELPTWESLTPEQKKLYARQAEVFAAYATYNDYEIGRWFRKYRMKVYWIIPSSFTSVVTMERVRKAHCPVHQINGQPITVSWISPSPIR